MLVMYLNVDCMIFFYMLDDFFDNGYDLFDFIFILYMLKFYDVI